MPNAISCVHVVWFPNADVGEAQQDALASDLQIAAAGAAQHLCPQTWYAASIACRILDYVEGENKSF